MGLSSKDQALLHSTLVNESAFLINYKAVPPSRFIYKWLRHISGAQGATDYDMVTNSSLAAPSVFGYTATAPMELSALIFGILDTAMAYDKFGGLAALTNGCKFQIFDTNGTTVLVDILDGVPIKTNHDMQLISGNEQVFYDTNAVDSFPGRLLMDRAGAPMQLTAGQSIRWTNQDNLTGLAQFRVGIQGIYLA